MSWIAKTAYHWIRTGETHMQKYGLFDPGSLRRHGQGMAIDFINALDTTDVETISLERMSEVSQVMSQLEAQKNSIETPVLALGKETVRMKGAIMMILDQPGKGMIATHDKDGKKQVYSIKTVFDLDIEDMPEEGIGFASGYLDDGTLHAHQIAMKSMRPAGPSPQMAERVSESM